MADPSQLPHNRLPCAWLNYASHISGLIQLIPLVHTASLDLTVFMNHQRAVRCLPRSIVLLWPHTTHTHHWGLPQFISPDCSSSPPRFFLKHIGKGPWISTNMLWGKTRNHEKEHASDGCVSVHCCTVIVWVAASVIVTGRITFNTTNSCPGSFGWETQWLPWQFVLFFKAYQIVTLQWNACLRTFPNDAEFYIIKW